MNTSQTPARVTAQVADTQEPPKHLPSILGETRPSRRFLAALAALPGAYAGPEEEDGEERIHHGHQSAA
ncbi:hypothetical protein [Streptosporangium sandarakinum]